MAPGVHQGQDMMNETEIKNDNQAQETKETEVTMQPALDTSTIKDIDVTIANLHIVREQAKELADHVQELERKLSLARGTGDLTERARIATQMDVAVPHDPPIAVPRTRTARGTYASSTPRKPATNKERVETALRGYSLNTAQVAKVTGLSVGKSSEAIRQLRGEKKIANVGTEDFPKWTLRIGDDTPTSVLNAEVRRLISDQAMTMRELVEVTGARTSRVSGAMVDIQRKEGTKVLNLGDPRRAKWLLLGENVKLGALSPKRGTDQES